MKKSSILIVLILCVALLTGMLLASCNAQDDTSVVSNSTILTDDVNASAKLASFTGGGIEGDPYIVDSAEKLLAIPTKGLDKHYLQTCDINLSGVTYTPIGARIEVDNGDGIPNDISGAFKGVYDGGNYEIQNLTLNSSSHCEALFASNTGTIKNVRLRGGSIKGSYYVAGFVGLNTGDIINCINYSCNISSWGAAGGIAGANWKGSISKCLNFASVTKNSDSSSYSNWNSHWYAGLPKVDNHPIGGITAVLTGSGTIVETANYGTVSSTKIGHAAGIAGAANGTISYCVNGGNVSNSGGDRAALIVCNTLNGLSISNTYNYGACTCNYNEYTNDSFVNFGDLANNQSNKVSASTFGSTNYANASAAISGYADNSKYVIDPQVNNGYPYLASTAYGDIYGVRGLENGSVTNGYNSTSGTAIRNASEFLSAIRPWQTSGTTTLSGNYYLTTDIDMSGWDMSMYDNDGNGSRESFWTNNTTNVFNHTEFSGTFDGNGHTITFNPASPSAGYSIACATQRVFSGFLFDRIINGTVKNVNLVFKGRYVGRSTATSGSNTEACVGGLAGSIEGTSKIMNCSVTYEEGSYYEHRIDTTVYGCYGALVGSVGGSSKITDTTVTMNGTFVSNHLNGWACASLIAGFSWQDSNNATIMERCSVYSDTTSARLVGQSVNGSNAGAIVGEIRGGNNSIKAKDLVYGYIGTIEAYVSGSTTHQYSRANMYVGGDSGSLSINRVYDLSRNYSDTNSYTTGSARFNNKFNNVSVLSTAHYFRPLLVNSVTNTSFSQNNARITRVLLDPTNPKEVVLRALFNTNIPNGYYALAQVTADNTTPYSGPSATADGLILIGDNDALIANNNLIYLRSHKEDPSNAYATIRIGTKAKVSVNNTSFTSGDNKTYGDLANELINATPNGNLSSGSGYWTGTTNMVQSLGSNARVRIYDHNMAIAYESWNSSYASSTDVLEPGTYYAKYATSLSPMGISMLSVPAISLNMSSTNNVNNQFYVYLEDENTITFNIVERDLVNGSVVDGYNSTKGTAISSWADFLSFRQYVVGGTYGWANVTGNYYLTQDIVAPEGWDYFEGYTSSGWDGADNSPKAINFSGIFDGNGHTITFSPISDNGADYTYAFGYSRDQVGYIVDKLSGTGTIKNLNVVFTGATNYKFRTTSDYGYQCAFGGLVGIMQDNSRINNCTITYESGSYIEMRTDASPSNHNNYNMLGGMVGRMGGTDDSSSNEAKNNPITSGNIQIIDSTVTIDGTLKHTQSNNATDWLAVGGFAGQACASSSQLFTRCALYGTGIIEGACKSDKGANVAGFIGEIKHGNSSETVAHTAIDLVYGFQGSINSTGASTSSYNRRYCITTLQGGATLNIDRVFYFDAERSYTNGSNVNLGSEPSYAWGISTISSKVQIFRAIVPNSNEAVTLNASNAYLDRIYFTPGLEQNVVVRGSFTASIPDDNYAFVHGNYIDGSYNHVNVFNTNANGGVDGLQYIGSNSDIGSGVEFTIPFENYSGKALYAVARINKPSTFDVSNTTMIYSSDNTASDVVSVLRNNLDTSLSSAVGYWYNTHTSVIDVAHASVEVLDSDKNVIFESWSNNYYDVRLNAGTYYARYRTTLTDEFSAISVLNIPGASSAFSQGTTSPIGVYLYDDETLVEIIVNQKDINVTIDDITAYYGDDVSELNLTYSESDLELGDSLDYALQTPAAPHSDVGTYAITGTDFDDNYNIIFTEGTFTIIARPITVTIADKGTPYGTDIVALTANITTGNLVNDDENVYTLAKEDGLAVGTYAITGTTTNNNYAITFIDGSYVISKKQINVILEDKSSTYGENQVALTFSTDGLVYGDTIDVLNIALNCAVDNTSSAGEYAITCSSATADNYDITAIDGTYTVTPLAITIKPTNGASTYGEELAIPSDYSVISTNQLINGDTLSVTISLPNGVTKYSDATTYELSISATHNNYAITTEAGTYTINRRPVTITIDDMSATYGETINSLSSRVSAGSIVNNDSVYTLTKEDGLNANTYGITGLAINGNYDVTFVGSNGTDGVFTITPKAVTVSLNNYVSIYGEALEEIIPVANGLANGETIDVLNIAVDTSSIKDATTYDLKTFTTYNNGNYDVTLTDGTYEVTKRKVFLDVTSYEIFYGDTWTIPADCYTESTSSPYMLLDGDFAPGITVSREEGNVANTPQNPNYDIYITWTNDNYDITILTDGVLVINKKVITLYIDDVTTDYGDAVITEFTFSDNDNAIVDGDQDKISPYYSTNVSGTRPYAGNYEIEAYSLNTNYAITFEKGVYTINKKAITVNIDDKSSTYGDNIEELTSDEASVVLSGDDLGLTLTAEVSTTSNYGEYDITASYTNTNYDVTFVGSNGANGVYTITKRTITFTIYDKSAIYGESFPTLEANVTVGSIVNNDSVCNISKEDGFNVGTYRITGLASNDNYDVTFVSEDGTRDYGIFTIGKRAINILVGSLNSFYGDALNTNFFYIDVDNALIDGDSIDVDYVTTIPNVAYPDAGEYDIEATATNDNYDINVEFGKYTIKPREITITIHDQEGDVGEAIKELTYDEIPTIGNIVNGDDLQITISTTATNTSSRGEYPITGTWNNDNYAVTFIDGTYVLSQSIITITIASKTQIYGEAEQALEYVVTGEFAEGDDESIFNIIVSRESGNDVGTYAITAQYDDNDSYFVNVIGANYVITTRNITITADNQSSIYGDAIKELSYSVVATNDDLTGNVICDGDELNITLSTDARRFAKAQDYVINVSSDNDNGNYDVTLVNAIYSLNKRDVSVVADYVEQVFGNESVALTYVATGLVNNDILSGALARESGNTVGSYAISQGTLANENYVISFTSNYYAIVGRQIVITPDNVALVYGDAPVELTYQVTNGANAIGTALVDGYPLEGALTRENADIHNAGTYLILQGTLNNEDDRNVNYEIAFATGKTYFIDKRASAITPNGVTLVDGEYIITTNYSNSAYEVTGTLSHTEDGAVVTATSTGDNTNVTLDGTFYLITLSAQETTNYYAPTGVEVKLFINPYNVGGISATILDSEVLTKVYGDTDPEFKQEVIGLNGETFSVAFTRTAGENVTSAGYSFNGVTSLNNNYIVALTDSNTRFTITKRDYFVTPSSFTYEYGAEEINGVYYDSVSTGYNNDRFNVVYTHEDITGVGSFDITGISTINPNYNLILATGTGEGKIVITERYVYVVAENKSVIFGESTELTFTANGLLASDTIDNVFTGSLSREEGTDVGTYAITLGTLQANGNYLIKGFTGATYTIDVRAITLTPTGFTKEYGNADGTISYIVTTGSLATGVTGATLDGTLSREEGENAGSYLITLGTISNANYAITIEEAYCYIEPKAVIVTPDAGQGHVYGDSDNTITYTTTALAFEETALLGSLSRESGKNVGEYAITLGDMDTANANYTVTLAETTVYYVITARPIKVIARDTSRYYGDMDGALLYDYEGTLLAGDSFTGKLERVSGEDVDVYSIVRGTLNIANYEIEFVAGEFTIIPRPVTVTIGNQSSILNQEIVIDQTNYEVTVGNVIRGDDLGIVISKADGIVAGYYTLSGEATNANYAVTFVDGVFHIYGEIAKFEIYYDEFKFVYNGSSFAIPVSVTSGAPINFYVDGAPVENAFINPGIYEVTLTSQATEQFAAPSPITVTVIIYDTVLKENAHDLSVIIESSNGFAPDTTLVLETITSNSEVGTDIRGIIGSHERITSGYNIIVKGSDVLDENATLTIKVKDDLIDENGKVKVVIKIAGEYHIAELEVVDGAIHLDNAADVESIGFIEIYTGGYVKIALIILALAIVFLIIVPAFLFPISRKKKKPIKFSF